MATSASSWNCWYMLGSFLRMSSGRRREAMSRKAPPCGLPRPSRTSCAMARATTSRVSSSGGRRASALRPAITSSTQRFASASLSAKSFLNISGMYRNIKRAPLGQARILVAAEVALQDAAVGRAVEEGAPGLELVDPRGRLLGMDLRHAPVVQEFPAPHGVAEVDLPAVARIGGGERGGHPALGHHRVRLPEQRLADQADRATLGRRL